MKKKIIWIASYPKSGNTWARTILTSLFFTKDGKFDFEILKSISIFENVERFEFVKEINLEDYKKLNELETLSKYWIECQKRTEMNGDFIFFKTHHSCITYQKKFSFTNLDNSIGLIYLIRDPRDVVISYSKHMGWDIDHAIELMKKRGAINYYSSKFEEKRNKYPAVISSWDEHIESWQTLNVPKLIIKYEDLLENTKETLIKIVNFFQNKYPIKFRNLDEKIDNIILTTKFEILKNHEQKYGFSESSKNSNFFRIGKKNQWEKTLTNEQIRSIEGAFEKKMKEFNYL